MKLRNRKTGEIIDVYKGNLTIHYNQGRKTIHFKSLEELEDWEDYEKTKQYWCISPFDSDVIYVKDANDEVDAYNRQIGNYFETKEEAEHAMEKLKAWKRLKDKGFKFLWWISTSSGDQVDYYIPEYNDETVQDLNLLFGGEDGKS